MIADVLAKRLLVASVFSVAACVAWVSATTEAFASATAEAQTHYADAERFMSDGHVRSAVIELKNALLKNPADIHSRRLLAEAYMAQGEGSAAEAELRRIAKLPVIDADWVLAVAESMSMQGRHRDILDKFEDSAEFSPKKRAVIQVARGRALRALNQPQEALAAFEQALRLQPDFGEAAVAQAWLRLEQGQAEAASELLATALESNRQLPSALLLRAHLRASEGQLEEAEADLRRLRELDPTNAEALALLAALKIRTGRADATSQDLEALDRIKAAHPAAEYLRAVLDFRDKEYARAEEHVKNVLRQQPSNEDALLMLGVIAYVNDEFEMALAFLIEALEKRPDSIELRKLLAAVALQVDEPDRAIAALQPASDSTDDLQLLILLASAYAAEGDNAAAARTFARALELAPDIAALRTQLAIGLYTSGGEDQGLAALQTSVELFQGDFQPLAMLTLAYIDLGKREQALRVAEGFARAEPQRPEAHNLAGIVQLSLQNTEEAAIRFQRALDIDPRFNEAELNLSRVDLIKGDTDKAERRYRNVLDREPSSLGALLGMAALSDEREETAAVAQWVERARAEHPDAVQPGLLLVNHYLRIGDTGAALSLATQLRQRFDRNPVIISALARAQLASGNSSTALRNFETVVALQPGSPAALAQLRKAQAQTGVAKADAVAPIDLRSLDSGDLPGMVALAGVEIEGGRLNNAAEIVKRLRERYPDRSEPYRLDGIVKSLHGQERPAIAALQKAYRIEKTGRVAQLLAKLHAQQTDTSAAVEILRDWLGVRPSDVDTRRQLALLLHGNGREDAAIAEYERLLVDAGEDPEALNNLAWLYLEKDKAKEALRLAGRARTLAPDDQRIADTYGWILLQNGQTERAVSVLREVWRYAPTDPEVTFHTAAALAAAGRSNKARSLLEWLVREAADTPQARLAAGLLAELPESE